MNVGERKRIFTRFLLKTAAILLTVCFVVLTASVGEYVPAEEEAAVTVAIIPAVFFSAHLGESDFISRHQPAEPASLDNPPPPSEYFIISMIGDCTLGSSHYSRGIIGS